MKQLLMLGAATLSMVALAAGADPEKRNTVIRKPATAQVAPSEVAPPPRADNKIVVAERDEKTRSVPNGPWKPRQD